MKILIIGAGVAGLSAAALLQEEHDITIIEAHDSFSQKGYAIGLWANTKPILEKIGIWDELAKHATFNPDFRYMNEHGKTFIHAEMGDELLNATMSHDTLRSVLETSLDTDVLYQTTVQQLRETPLGVYASINGSEELFDMVIAADGVHSWTREKYFKSRKEDIGWSCHWGWTPIFEDHAEEAVEVIKPGAIIGIYGTVEDKGCGIATIPSDETFEEALADFTDFGAKIRDSMTEVHSSKLYWVYCEKQYTDQIVLIGDAAHAMPPFGGVGATMAIEDAWVLSEELDEKDLAVSFKRFSERRQPRIALARKQTQQEWKWKNISNPVIAEARNFLAAHISIEHFLQGFRNMVHEKP